MEFALEAILTAARYLEFSGIDELEPALAEMHALLVKLASAGVLAEMTFALQDQQGICGARVILDPWDVSDFEEVDLSRLRLVANGETSGSVEIVCTDSAFAEAIVGTDFLPAPSAVLEWNLVNINISGNEIERREEDTDGYDYHQGWGEHSGKSYGVYDEYPPADGLQD